MRVDFPTACDMRHCYPECDVAAAAIFVVIFSHVTQTYRKDCQINKDNNKQKCVSYPLANNNNSNQNNQESRCITFMERI